MCLCEAEAAVLYEKLPTGQDPQPMEIEKLPQPGSEYEQAVRKAMDADKENGIALTIFGGKTGKRMKKRKPANKARKVQKKRKKSVE